MGNLQRATAADIAAFDKKLSAEYRRYDKQVNELIDSIGRSTIKLGDALLKMRGQWSSYRRAKATDQTWAEYLKSKAEMSESHGRRLIAAAQTAKLIETATPAIEKNASIDAESLEQLKAIGSKALGKKPSITKEQLVQIWKLACKLADGDKPTGKQVDVAMRTVLKLEEPTTKSDFEKIKALWAKLDGRQQAIFRNFISKE